MAYISWIPSRQPSEAPNKTWESEGIVVSMITNKCVACAYCRRLKNPF